MNKILQIAGLTLLLTVTGGCESRTDKTDGGGVLLSVSDFDGRPFGVFVNSLETPGFVTIDSVTIENIVKDPTGASSDLMNVELESYQVTYERLDDGTRVPPTYFRTVFGVIPAGGNIVIEPVPFMGSAQLTNPPLSDLLIENGAFDKETGARVITLSVTMVFFGRTLSGDPVSTAPASFSVEFRP